MQRLTGHLCEINIDLPPLAVNSYPLDENATKSEYITKHCMLKVPCHENILFQNMHAINAFNKGRLSKKTIESVIMIIAGAIIKKKAQKK